MYQPVATRPLAIQKDATWYCYGWDLTKNICELFGSDGYIKTTYSYTPYGAVTVSGTATQPIQWSSEFYDDELGLLYYNYRHYNANDGRWLGRDWADIDRDKNSYIYLKNALDKIDRLGLFADSLIQTLSQTAESTMIVVSELATSVITGVVEHYNESVNWGNASCRYYEDKVPFGSSVLGCMTGVANFIGVVDVIEAIEGQEVILPDNPYENTELIDLSGMQRVIHGGTGAISAVTAVAGGGGLVKYAGKEILHNYRFMYYSNLFPKATRVGSGMKADAAHRITSFVTPKQWRQGKFTYGPSGDGKAYAKMKLEGEITVKGETRKGTFEAVINPRTKEVTHQFFNIRK